VASDEREPSATLLEDDVSGASPLAVGVCGSPRRRANSGVLAEAALDELASLGCRCEKIRLARHRLSPCLAHDHCADFAACPQDDDVTAILDLVYAADVLVLATPVYYENVSAQLKMFMDRNLFRYSHDQWLRARAVGLIAVTAETGLDDALGAMRRYVALSTKGGPVVLTLGGYADEAGAAARDAELTASARKLGRDLAASIGLAPA
jgi:multimeric flavodoxin WrbA